MMETSEFREFAKATIDYICDYSESLDDLDVLPSVEPGFLKGQIPEEAPEDGDDWKTVLKDIDKIIVPGMVHWRSPHFFAYFPSVPSYPSMVGELLSAGLHAVGFSWESNPIGTELELATVDWLAKLLGLPDKFHNSAENTGGGLIQGSASESTLFCLLLARQAISDRMTTNGTSCYDPTKLVAYSSRSSNSSVEKAGRLAGIRITLVDTDEEGRMRGEQLAMRVSSDINQGLLPFCVIATLGTTSVCAMDPLDEIAPICKKYNLWFHVDAAYAGAAFVCPEYRHLLKGIEDVHSFNMNPHKWLLVNFDCSVLWFEDMDSVADSFLVNRVYLKGNKSNQKSRDLKDLQIPLGRKFRALKLWLTLRMHGASGLRNHIRRHCQMADYFAELVKHDSRFTVVSQSMGLVTFRFKGSDKFNQNLIWKINRTRKAYMVGGSLHGQIVLRLAISGLATQKKHLEQVWDLIQNAASNSIE